MIWDNLRGFILNVKYVKPWNLINKFFWVQLFLVEITHFKSLILLFLEVIDLFHSEMKVYPSFLSLETVFHIDSFQFLLFALLIILCTIKFIDLVFKFYRFSLLLLSLCFAFVSVKFIIDYKQPLEILRSNEEPEEF